MPWNEDGTRKNPSIYQQRDTEQKQVKYPGSTHVQSSFQQRVEPTSDNTGGDETYAPQDKPEPAGSPYTMKGHALPGPFRKVKRHYDSYNAAKAANAPLKHTTSDDGAELPAHEHDKYGDSEQGSSSQASPNKKVKRHYDSYNAAKAANAPLKQRNWREYEDSKIMSPTSYGEKYGQAIGGPFNQRSPLQQKIWEKGGWKKQVVDPVKSFVSDYLPPAAYLSGLGFLGMKGMEKVVTSNPVSSLHSSAGAKFIGDVAKNVGSSNVGKFASSTLSKVQPLIMPAAAIAGGYVAGQGLKGILNWINRGVRNVIVTGERKGTDEFRSKYGLTEEGKIDWKGHKGGAGRGELSKKNRKEKGIKIDFR